MIIFLVPLFLFLFIALFQLIPIPLSVIEGISPSTAALYNKLGLSSNIQHLTFNFASPFLPLSLSIYSTTTAILKWFAYTGAFILVATFNPPEEELSNGNWIKIICIAFFIIGFVEAIYGLYMYLNHSGSLLWFARRIKNECVNGTYINRNHFAGFMNICILVTMGFFIAYIGSFKKKNYKVKEALIKVFTANKAPIAYLYVFGIVVMILALMFSLSRMGQFSLIAGFISIGMLYTARKMKLPLFILTFILCLSFLWGAWKGLEPIEERWRALDPIHEGRAMYAQATLKLSSDYPLLGTGLGSYELAFPPYKPAKINAGIVDHAHNDYLEMLSEVGWIGFICWFLFFLIYLYFTVSLWLIRRNPFSRGIGAGGIAAVISMMVHSFADFNLQIPANALLTFIVMAITWQAVNSSFSTYKTFRNL